VKEVPKSIKLQGAQNYVLWSYKVKMLLMQQDMWKHVEASSDRSRSSTFSENRSLDQEDSSYGVAISALAASENIKTRITVGRLIMSTLIDSIMLNVIYLHDSKQIWDRLHGKYNIQSSSRRLALEEKLYSLWLREGKSIDTHLQGVILLVHQLVGLGVAISNDDLVDLTLTTLPKSWAIFRQIYKHSLPSFPILEGLFFQEEITRELQKGKDELEEILYLGQRGGSNKGRAFGRY
jgi:hypothetical protein